MPSFYKLGTANTIVNGKIFAIKQYGSNLFVGGDFTAIGGVVSPGIARWDGTNWFGVNGGVSLTNGTARVNTIEVYNGELFIAGLFDKMSTESFNNVIRLNSNFQYISEVPGGGLSGFEVSKLKVVDGELLASVVHLPNTFTTPLVSWDIQTSTWGNTETNILYHNEDDYTIEGNTQTNYSPIRDFVKFNDKIFLHNGSNVPWGTCVVYNGKLYANNPTSDIRLGVTTNLQTWSRVGGGFASQTTNSLGYKWNTDIRTLYVYAGKLFVGGNFFNVGNHTNGLLGIATSHMAIWDDNNWSSIGTGVTENRGIYSFCGTEDPIGNLAEGLYLGGHFNKRPPNQSTTYSKIALYDVFETYVEASDSLDLSQGCPPFFPCDVRLSLDRKTDGCFIEGPPGPPGPQGAPGADGQDGIGGTDIGDPVDCNETFNAKIVNSELIDPNVSSAKWKYTIKKGYINSNNEWFFGSTELDAYNMMETNNTTTTALGFSIQSDGQGGNSLSNFPGFSVKPIPNDTILPVTAVCFMPDTSPGVPAGQSDVPNDGGGGSDPNDQPRDTAGKINYFSSPNPIDGDCSSIALSGETPLVDPL